MNWYKYYEVDVDDIWKLIYLIVLMIKRYKKHINSQLDFMDLLFA